MYCSLLVGQSAIGGFLFNDIPECMIQLFSCYILLQVVGVTCASIRQEQLIRIMRFVNQLHESC